MSPYFHEDTGSDTFLKAKAMKSTIPKSTASIAAQARERSSVGDRVENESAGGEDAVDHGDKERVGIERIEDQPEDGSGQPKDAEDEPDGAKRRGFGDVSLRRTRWRSASTFSRRRCLDVCLLVGH